MVWRTTPSRTYKHSFRVDCYPGTHLYLDAVAELLGIASDNTIARTMFACLIGTATEAMDDFTE